MSDACRASARGRRPNARHAGILEARREPLAALRFRSAKNEAPADDLVELRADRAGEVLLQVADYRIDRRFCLLWRDADALRDLLDDLLRRLRRGAR